MFRVSSARRAVKASAYGFRSLRCWGVGSSHCVVLMLKTPGIFLVSHESLAFCKATMRFMGSLTWTTGGG